MPAEPKPRTGPWLMGKRFLLQKAEPEVKLALKFIRPPCLQGHGEKKPTVSKLSKAVWKHLSTPRAAYGVAKVFFTFETLSNSTVVCISAFSRKSKTSVKGEKNPL